MGPGRNCVGGYTALQHFSTGELNIYIYLVLVARETERIPETFPFFFLISTGMKLIESIVKSDPKVAGLKSSSIYREMCKEYLGQ